jgi:transposase
LACKSDIVSSLVTVDDWPITCHVLNGNWRDARTVPEVRNNPEQRFAKRVVFVGDRDMV